MRAALGAQSDCETENFVKRSRGRVTRVLLFARDFIDVSRTEKRHSAVKKSDYSV